MNEYFGTKQLQTQQLESVLEQKVYVNQIFSGGMKALERLERVFDSTPPQRKLISEDSKNISKSNAEKNMQLQIRCMTVSLHTCLL